jgi:outer membrane protein OmpA-like peptidoglycan-associated protein
MSPALTPARPRVRQRLVRRTAVLAAAALGSTVLGVSAAHAVPSLAVTSTSTTSVRPHTTTALEGLSVTDSNSADVLQVTVSTDVGTLTMPTTSGLTLAYGNDWSGDAAITFTGSPANADAGLGAVELVSGDNGGTTAHIAVNALVSEPGYVYSPANEHFYEYVSDPGVTWTAAKTLAAQRTFNGQTGYLATIPNSTVNDLISSKIAGALNVWFGATAVETAGAPIQRTWEWVGGPLAGQAFSYCSNYTGSCDFVDNTGLYSSWASGEPNNAGEETAPVTNWSGSVGRWNDLSPSNTAGVSGFVVEYGDQPVGASSYAGVVNDSADVTIEGPPNMPTNVSASRGNGLAHVSFTAPKNNGHAITGYTVTATPAGGGDPVTATCAASPCTIDGLTNGTAYTVTVRATNSMGDSAESDSTTVTPATVPDAPTGVDATRGDTSASVSFTAGDDGGSPITGYTATATPVGGGSPVTASCASSPCTVTGLANGTAYTFTVHATNTVGSSAESQPSGAVTPATVPGAPVITGAAPADGKTTVTFTAPADNGADIDSYTVTATPVGGGVPATATCASSPCAIDGLTNGVAYRITVHATNAVGDGAESGSVDSTPATVPDAPANLTVTRGDGELGLSFDPPAFDGGSAVTGYQVTLDGGDTWETLSTSGSAPVTATLTGLTNGTSYDIEVRAVNDQGTSDPASAGQHVPAGAPAAPTNVEGTPGDEQATVTFDAPADNGSAITGYTVRVSDGTNTHDVSCDASPCLVTGLTNGTAYTFSVLATNDVGDSVASDPSDAVTPVTVPGAPTDLVLGSQDGSASVSFAAPASDGGTPITGYEVSLDGGDWVPLTTTGTDTLSAVLTGLTDGTSYSARVRAVNAVGGGAASDAADVTPAGTPDVPRSVQAVLHGTSATITWQAPASDGGSPVIGYVVTAQPGGMTCTTTGATSCTITGLAPRKSYTFQVVAVNTRTDWAGTGTGPVGDSASLRVVTKPETPTGPTGHGRDRRLTVTWTAPANPGTSSITGYRVSIDRGRTWTTVHPTGGERLSATIVPVRNGRTYPVQVRALNRSGAGPASRTVKVTVAQWFRDRVSQKQRRHEVAVPRHPASYHGRLRHTVATMRTHAGAPAYPAAKLAGRQLQSGEAVSFTSEQMFAFNQARLTDTGRAELRSIVKSLRYVKALTCEGYADFGGWLSNERRLARSRAHVVCSALRSYGAHVVVRTKGYGSSRPVVIGGTSKQRAANRRVVVVVTRG